MPIKAVLLDLEGTLYRFYDTGSEWKKERS
jgi:FMN phosphatase YigB (HAD superfamily)